MPTQVTIDTNLAETEVTITTNDASTNYTLSAGARGPTGAAGPNTVTTSTTTNITGIIKGNGSVVSQAISGTDYAAALGANDNYVTDAQLVVIGNTSGTNTGDQFTSVTASASSADTQAAAVQRRRCRLATVLSSKAAAFDAQHLLAM